MIRIRRSRDDKLLKLAYSPAEQPRFDWMETIVDAPQELSDKLTPTLRREVESTLERLYGEADAAERLPTACPYSWDEICQQDWYPVYSEP